MKILTTSLLVITSLAVHGAAQAGGEITPGNYRSAVAYDTDSGGVANAQTPACLYIPNTPPPDRNAFFAQLVVDGGPTAIVLACARLSKGKVKVGPPASHTVKEYASAMVMCTGKPQGDPSGTSVAFIFQPVSKGDKAKLRKAQLFSGLLIGGVYADFVQDKVACPAPIP